jgi:hypothetical protein
MGEAGDEHLQLLLRQVKSPAGGYIDYRTGSQSRSLGISLIRNLRKCHRRRRQVRGALIRGWEEWHRDAVSKSNTLLTSWERPMDFDISEWTSCDFLSKSVSLVSLGESFRRLEWPKRTISDLRTPFLTEEASE